MASLLNYATSMTTTLFTHHRVGLAASLLILLTSAGAGASPSQEGAGVADQGGAAPERVVKVRSGSFVALDQIQSSPADNKKVALPRLRATRAPRKRVGTIGDVKEWKRGTSVVKRNLESVVPKGYSTWSSNLHRKELVVRGGTYTWDNIGVTAAPDAHQLKWGTRELNCPERLFRNCDFTRIPKEHGLYVSSYANTTLDGCTFLMTGSQGAQFAHRSVPYQQYDPDCLPYQSPPTHVVRNCHFVDCGFKGARPSFNLTYFDPGTSSMPGTLLVEDSSFVCRWPEVRKDGHRSTGAIVVTNMRGAGPLDANLGPMMKSVTLRNCLFDFASGDREIVDIRSSAEIVIEDCAFIARQHTRPHVLIDRDNSGNDLNGTKSERIVLRNNRSRGVTMRVQLRSEDSDRSFVEIPLNGPGEERIYSAVTGSLISKRSLLEEDQAPQPEAGGEVDRDQS